MNRNNIIFGLLVVAVLGVGVFAFFQTQNLTTLQTEATSVANDLRDAGTQAVDNAIATSTAFAESAYATSTQGADNAIATSTDFADTLYNAGTQAVDEANSTATQVVSEANGTATQAADSANRTATQVADTANDTATEVANAAATESALGTQTANDLATEQLELTVAAQVYSDVEATLSAQNVAILRTVAANGYIGDGLFSDGIVLPDGFTAFEGTGYTLAIPEGFIVGDFAADTPDIEALESAFDELGLNENFSMLQATDGVLFVAVDTVLLGITPRSTISLVREPVPSAETSVNDYINSAYFGLEGNFALLTADVLPINGVATGRVLIDQTTTSNSVRQLQYIFREGEHFYVLTFTAPISEYANVRVMLENVALSLRLTE
ncbi:MAG: hypothetical protein AAFV98_16200 [Chloroflexota bacterium]